MIFKIILSMSLFFGNPGLYAQDNNKQPADLAKSPLHQQPPINRVVSIAPKKDMGIHIEYFAIRDFSKKQYWVSISCPEPTRVVDQLNGKKNAQGKMATNPFRLQMGDIKTDTLRGTAYINLSNQKTVNFQIIAYSPIESQKENEVKLFYNENGQEYEIDSYIYPVVNTDDKPNQQPLVLKLDPKGGEEGDTITVHGKNFGDDIDDISIEFVDDKSFENPDGITIERYISEIKPFFLSSNDSNMHQTIRFSIPIGKNLLQNHHNDETLNKKVFFRNPIKMRVIVRGRPSDYITFSVLPADWKGKTVLLSIAVVMLLLSCIAIMVGKLNYFPLILLEPATNTYSLSKFQALAWTLTLLGSYFFLAVAHGLLLRNGKIPDFNPSLLALMSISYGGLLTANSLGNKKAKNDPNETPPKFKNLFMEGGGISLPRLQLFTFTIVGIIIYIYTLYTANLLQGLPDIPPTLLGLLGVSQGGYLGGKAMGDKIHVNMISPRKLPLDFEEKITLVGSGFQPETKVLFSGFQPITCEYLNPNSICFTPPNFTKLGDKQMTLIPPSGSPIIVNSLLSIVEQEELAKEEGDYVAVKKEKKSDELAPAGESPTGEP